MPSSSMITSTLAALLLVLLVGSVEGHMTIWTRSMYGVSGTRTGRSWYYTGGDPAPPISPGLVKDQWWFRGPSFRNLPPPSGQVTRLPAGKTIKLEIACHIAWTSYGWRTTVPGSPLDACPGGTAGVYHSGDPNAFTIDKSLLSGCALGIADVDDINKVTMDNMVIFSVQHNCVQQKVTEFAIPKMMPKCTGKKCICAWFWLGNTGQANWYMTGFDCSVSNVSPSATKIAPPKDPKFCLPSDKACKPQKGAKRPLYAYGTPTNVKFPYPIAYFNANRPGYHASWSFENGAQNDIFLPSGKRSRRVKRGLEAVRNGTLPDDEEVMEEEEEEEWTPMEPESSFNQSVSVATTTTTTESQEKPLEGWREIMEHVIPSAPSSLPAVPVPATKQSGWRELMGKIIGDASPAPLHEEEEVVDWPIEEEDSSLVFANE
ncbi:hypothetical protein T439DRAFT_377579 [Meredithblackwellia eburnea MCA 4105]